MRPTATGARAGAAAPAPGGVRLAVRLTPKASRNAVGGIARLADGGAALKVSVTAVPEAGKANAALVGLLARALGVPRGAVAIVRGATARDKLLAIAGNTDDLTAAIARLETGSVKGKS